MTAFLKWIYPKYCFMETRSQFCRIMSNHGCSLTYQLQIVWNSYKNMIRYSYIRMFKFNRQLAEFTCGTMNIPRNCLPRRLIHCEHDWIMKLHMLSPSKGSLDHSVETTSAQTGRIFWRTTLRRSSVLRSPWEATWQHGNILHDIQAETIPPLLWTRNILQRIRWLRE